LFADILDNSGGGEDDDDDDHHHHPGYDASAFTVVKYMVLPYQQPQLLSQLNALKN
jgi:hypothetical protein